MKLTKLIKHLIIYLLIDLAIVFCIWDNNPLFAAFLIVGIGFYSVYAIIDLEGNKK